MLTYFTTTTAPPFVFSAPDPNNPGQAVPGFADATFRIFFVNIANNQKYEGNGGDEAWTIIDADKGIFQYQMSDTDFANAYATTGASNPGTATFDICVQIIATKEWDPQPSRIAIRKI
jgi:hypothetical protein